MYNYKFVNITPDARSIGTAMQFKSLSASITAQARGVQVHVLLTDYEVTT